MLLSALLLLSSQAAPAVASPPVVVGPNQMPPAMVEELRRAVHPPQPRLPIQTIFSPDDYPARGDGRRGKVAIRLLVSPQGSIIGCSITQSSGQSALDWTTCNVVRRRERYTPALDKDGQLVLGMVDETVDWDAVFKRVRVIRGN